MIGFITGNIVIDVLLVIVLGAVAVFVLGVVSDLSTTESERRFEQVVRERPLLSDDEFVAAYYSDQSVPREILIRLKTELVQTLGEEWEKVVPTDNPGLIHNEIDPWDIFCRLSRVFGVPISLEDAKSLDGSFDSMARFLACRLAKPQATAS
jgi:hypothetical protein